MLLKRIVEGFISECHSLALCPSAVMLFIAGVLFYSILYPSPYINELPQKLPFAAVDQDESALSRSLLRAVDTTEGIKLIKYPEIESARDEMKSAKVSGILVIPKDFEKNILSGHSQSIPLYTDASHLLIYRSVLTGVQTTTENFAALSRASMLMKYGVSHSAAVSLQTTGRADVRIMYNSVGNYLLNTVPPVFVLILQQILMAGCALIEVTRRQAKISEGGVFFMFGRSLLPACLGVIFALYYFCILAYADDLYRPADFGSILLFLLPFFMASGLCGHLIGRFVRSHSLVLTVVLPISIPCLFLSGAIWPAENMGIFFGILRHFIPATPGINGYLLLAGRGASFIEVLPLFLEETGQYLILLGCALLIQRSSENPRRFRQKLN